MKTKEKPVKTYIGWILFTLLVIIVFLTFHSTLIRIITRYGLVLLSFSGVAIIFYSFAGIFTKKRLLKYIMSILLFALCTFIHIQVKNYHPQKVVNLKENVLYVIPKSDTLRNE